MRFLFMAKRLMITYERYSAAAAVVFFVVSAIYKE